MIVVAGAVGIEKASGQKVAVSTGRGDATQESTDVDSFDEVVKLQLDALAGYFMK